MRTTPTSNAEPANLELPLDDMRRLLEATAARVLDHLGSRARLTGRRRFSSAGV